MAAYVIAGGLRSTFIADYTHTVILFISIFVFGFVLYATSDDVGDLDRFYDLLVQASENMPIASNAGNGSYLTFRSVDGLVFAIDVCHSRHLIIYTNGLPVASSWLLHCLA